MELRPIKQTLLSAAVVGFLALPAGAASSPEAETWLDALAGVFDGGPFSVDYAVDLDLSTTGQATAGTMHGDVVAGDRDHMRVNMTIRLEGVPGAEGPTEMELQVVSVSDGEYRWIEAETPTTGTQYMKLSLAVADKLAEQSGAGFGGNPATLDPVGQLDALREMADFEVQEESRSSVTLRGRLTHDAATQLEEIGLAGIETLVLVFDKKTRFPSAIRFAGEKPVIAMTFSDFRRFSDGDVDADAFVYAPPEGVQVMDLGVLLESFQ